MRLVQEAQKAGFRLGVHFPLRAGRFPLRDPQFLTADDASRAAVYNAVEQELEFLAVVVQPAYVLFHFPKPVILDDTVDWSGWRFADRSEYVYERSYSLDEFTENSESLFAWLSEKGEAFGFTPVLELDALNHYIYEKDALRPLLDKYPGIKLCLDTARLFLQERIDPRFDAKSIIKRYAKYAETIHLSNVRLNQENKVAQSRFPALPSLDPDEGWAPIEAYLHLVRQHNKDVKIMFEHRSDEVSDEELQECYNWVERMLS
jgi:sugar phosphate isomerase/epimerase